MNHLVVILERMKMHLPFTGSFFTSRFGMSGKKKKRILFARALNKMFQQGNGDTKQN